MLIASLPAGNSSLLPITLLMVRSNLIYHADTCTDRHTSMHCMRACTYTYICTQNTHMCAHAHHTNTYTHLALKCVHIIDNSLRQMLRIFVTSSNADPNGTYQTKEWLERVLIIGITKLPSSITISSGS